MDAAEKHCKICFNATSKYVCPQCGINYCSSDCFRNPEKHLKCSEEFYKRCVMENIRLNTEPDDAAAREKMMKDILKRFHDQHPEGDIDFEAFAKRQESESEESDEGDETLDSDDDEPLESRLGEIDLDDAENVWEKLTKEEKDDFLRMVKQAQAKGVEVVSEPWFPGLKLVEELPSTSKNNSKGS